ncbi:MAG: hypothetical protein MSB11_07450, partial [Prevotella sp.]|nr:hypothetical protein [Prevotella sp.]
MRDYTDAELAEILDKDIFHKISEAADSLGMECYVVGGYVRDIFLERPSDDIDCVVVGSGIKVAKKLKNMLGRKASLSVFKNFGTAQVKIYTSPFDPSIPVEEREKGAIEVEFVGARKESYHRESRKPIVEDGTLEDDQNRRDFTINAMALDIHGNVYDYHDGQADLQKRILRPVGRAVQRYQEDALRMLRACRFVAQLGFDYVQDGASGPACGMPATPYYLAQVPVFPAERCRGLSLERVRTELEKLLVSEHA